MIYLDNAATTFKKPRSVIIGVEECLKKYCANAGRSSHKLALKTSEMIYETRERLALHLGSNQPENVIFFYNATHALNFAIKTSVKKGDHVIISDVEHNATLRPIYAMKSDGYISYSVFNSEGDIKSNISDLIKDNTTCIVSTLHSNVFGREIDPSLLIETAKDLNLTLILDASQYLGHKRIDLSNAKNVLLCAPGHKGLFGIQGCGFCVMTSREQRRTLFEGGSGSDSKSPFMPDNPPERYEAGTLGAPSVISLLKGLQFVEEVTTESILLKINDLSEYAKDVLLSIKGITTYPISGGIISFNVKNTPSEVISYELGRMNICTRAGLHCAPLAHKMLGTVDIGVVRVSLSYFNKKSDISKLYKKLKYISGIY